MKTSRLLVVAFIIVFFTWNPLSGQKSETQITYLRTLGIGFSGGANYMLSDFNKKIVGYVGGVNFNLLFPIKTHNTSLGLRGELQYGKFKGREEFPERTNGITRFSTDYYQALGGITFNIHLNGYTGSSLVLNALVGAIFFDPKDPGGYKLPNNKNEMYVKTKFMLYPSLEYKLWLSKGTSFNIEFATGLPLGNDYLDDVSVGAPDFFFDLKAGFSFYFLADYDEDNDGIPDEDDKCLGTALKYRSSILPNGCPSDNDNDGVYDEDDKCPNTADGASVDEDGCPIDSDGDGIPDYLDECPNTEKANIRIITDNGCSDQDMDGIPDYKDLELDTPINVTVDKDGRAIDTDNDGVPDYADKCNNTHEGYLVDSKGCPIDNDNDGILNINDRCSNEKETYNFYNDTDGCPDVTDYNIVEKFIPSSSVFNESGKVSESAKSELILYLLSWYDDYPETSWIIEVKSKNKAESKAKLLKKFFDEYLGDNSRTKVKYSVSSKEEINLLLDIEKARSIVKENMR